MKTRLVIVSFMLCLLMTGCSKNPKDDEPTAPDRICNPSSDGSITSISNGKPWNGCGFKAVYYSKDKILCIKAIDTRDSLELLFFITIDSVTPLKNYVIGPNTQNGIEIVELSFHTYVMDIAKPGMGGSFNLTQFDTLTGRLSANFSVNGFSPSLQWNISLTNGTINNLLFTKSTKGYPNNSYVSATVNGVNWYSRNLFSRIESYVVSSAYSFVNIRIQGYPGDFGDCPRYSWGGTVGAERRELSFQIPLFSGPGTYSLQPYNTVQQSPTAPKYLSRYNHRNYDSLFYPLSGSTITVLSIDSTAHRLDASFTTQTKDVSGNTVNFVNGKIHLEGWLPFPF